MARSLLLIF